MRQKEKQNAVALYMSCVQNFPLCNGQWHQKIVMAKIMDQGQVATKSLKSRQAVQVDGI